MYFNQVIVSSNEQIEYFSSQNDKKKAVHPIMRPPSLLPSRKTYLSIRRMLLTGKPRIHINYIRSTKRQYFNHIFLHTIEYTCFTCNPCIIRRKAFNIFYTKSSFCLMELMLNIFRIVYSTSSTFFASAGTSSLLK